MPAYFTKYGQSIMGDKTQYEKDMDNHSKYDESINVSKARRQLNDLESNQVKKWDGGTYEESLMKVMDKINNRKNFSYNLNGDALYQQYKDQYTALGKLAMQDTTATAQANSGGYANSYAATAGNQAYQGYLQKLNDIVPQLYQMAYDRYNQEGQDLYNKYGMMSDAYNREYSQYRDDVSDWNTRYDQLSSRYYNEANLDYNKFTSDRSWYTDRFNNQRTFDFDQYKQTVSEDQWDRNYDQSERQFAQNLALQYAQLEEQRRSNMANEAINRARASAASASAASTSGSGTSSKKSGVSSDKTVDSGNSNNAKNLMANMQTKNEFMARGRSENEYKNYINTNVQKYYNNGSLTKSEAAYIINYLLQS